MEKFILPFFYSLAFSVLLISVLSWVEKKYDLKAVRRLGGAAVILAFIILVLINRDLVVTRQIAGIVLGSILILFFGIWDDLKNLSWKKQIVFQVLVAFSAILFGVRSEFVTNPFGGIIDLSNPLIYTSIFTVYFLLFTNSLNWLDGIDGLSGTVTVVALAAIFFLSFKPEVNQPATAILTTIAAGAIAGFLIFNWKPSRILAGTAGAWFFGFLIASLSIFAGAKVATVLIVSLVPILDLVNVVKERYSAGKSIFFGGDDRHLQFKLLKLGLTETEIILMVSSLSALIAVVALSISASGKLFFILIFAALYFVFVRILKAKCEKF